MLFDLRLAIGHSRSILFFGQITRFVEVKQACFFAVYLLDFGLLCGYGLLQQAPRLLVRLVALADSQPQPIGVLHGVSNAIPYRSLCVVSAQEFSSAILRLAPVL